MDFKSNAPLLPSASKNGFFFGISLIILQVIFQFTKLENETIQLILTLAVCSAGIFFSVRNYRDKFNQGYISFKRVIGYSTLLSFLAGMISACFIYISLKYIDPSQLEKIIIASEEHIEKTIKNEAQQETMIELNRTLLSPGSIAISTIINNVIIGLLISIPLGYFIKREQPQQESTQEN